MRLEAVVCPLVNDNFRDTPIRRLAISRQAVSSVQGCIPFGRSRVSVCQSFRAVGQELGSDVTFARVHLASCRKRLLQKACAEFCQAFVTSTLTVVPSGSLNEAKERERTRRFVSSGLPRPLHGPRPELCPIRRRSGRWGKMLHTLFVVPSIYASGGVKATGPSSSFTSHLWGCIETSSTSEHLPHSLHFAAAPTETGWEISREPSASPSWNNPGPPRLH